MTDKYTLTLGTQVAQARKVKHLTAATNQMRDQIKQLEKDIVSAQMERDKALRRARELNAELAKAITWMDRARPVVRAAVKLNAAYQASKVTSPPTLTEEEGDTYAHINGKWLQTIRREAKALLALGHAVNLYKQGR